VPEVQVPRDEGRRHEKVAELGAGARHDSAVAGS